MDVKVTFNHSGEIRGANGKLYKWRERELVTIDEQTLSKLNPMTYRIRPELPTRTTMMQPVKEVQNPKREIIRNGGWWTLFEDGVRVKSARTKEELDKCL